MRLNEIVNYFKDKNGTFMFPEEIVFARHTESGERCFKCTYNCVYEAWVPEVFIKAYLLDFYPDNDHTFENMISGKTFKYESQSKFASIPTIRPVFIADPPRREPTTDEEYVAMVKRYIRIEQQALARDLYEYTHKRILVKAPKNRKSELYKGFYWFKEDFLEE